MQPLPITTAQWQALETATWLLFLQVFLAGLGAFSLAAAVIILPSLQATQAASYEKNATLARLFPLRPLFLVGAVVLLGGAVAALVATLWVMYPTLVAIYPRIWI
jgi:hypothetical protein